MKFKPTFILFSALLGLTSRISFADGGERLECSLKNMNPAGESQILQTKDAAIQISSKTPAGNSGMSAEIELTQGTYSAHAVLEPKSDVFFIDLQDGTGRESGLQSSAAAIRNSELSSTLKISTAGDWIYVECGIKN